MKNYLQTSVVIVILVFVTVIGRSEHAHAYTRSSSSVSVQQSEKTTPKRVRSEVLGVSIPVPKNAVGEHLSLGEASRLVLREKSNPPKWVITIRTVKMPESLDGPLEQDANPVVLARAFIEDARKISPELQVISTTKSSFKGQPSSKVIVQIPYEDTGKIARYEWIFIQTGPNRFILFEALSPGTSSGKSTVNFDSILNLMEVEAENTMAESWKDRLTAGARLISKINEQSLRELLENHSSEVWYRRFAYDADNRPIELGYVGVSMMEAPLGEMRKATPTPSNTGDTGFLVRIRTHLLPAQAGGLSSDVDTRGWMSWDREEEFISTVATTRNPSDGSSTSRSSNTLRPRPTAGKPIRTLDVIRQRQDSVTREQISLEVPDLAIFLSESELMILPQLLAHLEAKSGEFSTFAWQPQREEITRRLDEWRALPQGGHILRTRSYPDAPISTAQVDSDGKVRSRTIFKGSDSEEWIRMSPDELREHYRRAGISLDR